MIRASRIARRRTDAAVLLADQRLIRKLLVGRIAPQGRADMLVQSLGEGLGEAVRQRLQQDVIVIVGVRLEPREVRVDAVDRL